MIDLGERVFERRAAVPDFRAADRLRSVQVAQGGVVEAFEVPKLDGAGSSYGQRSLGLARRAAAREHVGDEHGSLRRIECRARSCDTRGESRVVVAEVRFAHDFADVRRLGVGERDQLDAAVLVVEGHPDGIGREASHHVDAAGGNEARAEGQSLGRIVVARDDHHADSKIECDASERLVQQSDCVGRRDGTVVDVARNDQRVGARFCRDRDDLVENPCLVVDEAEAVEASTEVPIRCVHEAHRRGAWHEKLPRATIHRRRFCTG